MTKIEWTEATWNPIVGCSLASPGCTNCYAMRAAYRMAQNPKTPQYHGTAKLVNGKPVWTGKIRLVEDKMKEPLRRKKPTMYFVNSMGDLFHEDIPDDHIDRVFSVMALCSQHTFQVLTKRSMRMRKYLNGSQADRPLPNVWLGVSIEDQMRARLRIPDLILTPAARRFISAEPLLGSLDLTTIQTPLEGTYLNALDGTNWVPGAGSINSFTQAVPALDWVICGGESGPGSRYMEPVWARLLRDRCKAAGVPFFMKQMTSKVPIPNDLQIREMPL